MMILSDDIDIQNNICLVLHHDHAYALSSPLYINDFDTTKNGSNSTEGLSQIVGSFNTFVGLLKLSEFQVS